MLAHQYELWKHFIGWFKSLWLQRMRLLLTKLFLMDELKNVKKTCKAWWILILPLSLCCLCSLFFMKHFVANIRLDFFILCQVLSLPICRCLLHFRVVPACKSFLKRKRELSYCQMSVGQLWQKEQWIPPVRSVMIPFLTRIFRSSVSLSILCIFCCDMALMGRWS